MCQNINAEEKGNQSNTPLKLLVYVMTNKHVQLESWGGCVSELRMAECFNILGILMVLVGMRTRSMCKVCLC